MWQTLLFRPLINSLIGFYHLFGNLGLAIIALTLVIRLLLLPFTLPALKAAQKMKELNPKLNKLKKKYKNDREKLAKAQLDLYRSAGVKPMAGFFPQIIQIVILIALYQVFRKVLGSNGGVEELNSFLYQPLKFAQNASLNLNFLYLNLTKPDVIKVAGLGLPGVFLILSGVSQFLSAKVMMPISKKHEKIAKKTPEKTDDFASMMQTQSLYMFPAMTILIGLSLPSGLALYWVIFSLFNLAQHLIIKNRSVKK